MKQDTTKPLWQQLNEQRTQGEWYIENKTDTGIWVGHLKSVCSCAALMSGINDDEKIANTRYTALAVNNLHLLAEALQTFVSMIDDKKARGKRITEHEWDIYSTSCETLNRIS